MTRRTFIRLVVAAAATILDDDEEGELWTPCS